MLHEHSPDYIQPGAMRAEIAGRHFSLHRFREHLSLHCILPHTEPLGTPVDQFLSHAKY